MDLLKRSLIVATMLCGQMVLASGRTVNDRLKVCDYNGGKEACHSDLLEVKYTNKIELLSNQVVLANGSTVSDRLRVCDYTNGGPVPCHFYLIQDKSLLPDVQAFVKTADSLDPLTLFDVYYTLDNQMYGLKVLTALYVRPTKAKR